MMVSDDVKLMRTLSTVKESLAQACLGLVCIAPSLGVGGR